MRFTVSCKMHTFIGFFLFTVGKLTINQNFVMDKMRIYTKPEFFRQIACFPSNMDVSCYNLTSLLTAVCFSRSLFLNLNSNGLKDKFL